jgi:hypothetical protein
MKFPLARKGILFCDLVLHTFKYCLRLDEKFQD